jgi:hypothetical protein
MAMLVMTKWYHYKVVTIPNDKPSPIEVYHITYDSPLNYNDM